MTSRHEAIRVGLAGLGRSGWDIHAPLLLQLADRYRIVAALDANPERRSEAAARFGCTAHADYADLLADPTVELVIVAMPNHLHAEFSIAALDAGKHVVCEKPMATSVEDARRMIAVAASSPGVLTVFQNRRYDPDFRQIQNVLASGVLGRIVAVSLTVAKFSRRWDWQTQTKYGGGELNNIGSHMLDLGLLLFGDGNPDVFCHRERTLTLGDAEDHVKIVLTGADAPIIDIEISSSCAYPPETWNIMGTRGGLAGTHRALRWKHLDPTDLPARSLDASAPPDRSYNQDDPDWHEEHWRNDTVFPAHHVGFYRDLFRTIRGGAPLVIEPASVLRVVELVETCRGVSALRS